MTLKRFRNILLFYAAISDLNGIIAILLFRLHLNNDRRFNLDGRYTDSSAILSKYLRHPQFFSNDSLVHHHPTFI
jgi:hypothetical protein